MSIPGWSIKDFHTKAWHVTKTYKQLWLLGLAVMVFTGSSNSNFGNVFDEAGNSNSDSQVEAQVNPTTDSEEAVLYRLDDELESQEGMSPNLEEEMAEIEAFEESIEAPAEAFFKEILTKIPPVAWLMTVLSIIGYIVIAVMTYVVGSGWSQAALILGVAEASEDKSPQISKVSVRGLHYVKTMFLVGLVPWLVFILALIGGGLLMAIIGGILQNGVVGLILGIGFFVALIVGFIMVNSTVTLAAREGVLHSTGAKKAISRGWEMSRLFWVKAFFLFFRNGLIEVLVMLGLFLPGIIALFEPVSKLADESALAQMSWESFAPGIVLVFAAMLAYFFFKSVYNVFTFTTWHLAHSVLRKSTPSLQRA